MAGAFGVKEHGKTASYFYDKPESSRKWIHDRMMEQGEHFEPNKAMVGTLYRFWLHHGSSEGERDELGERGARVGNNEENLGRGNRCRGK